MSSSNAQSLIHRSADTELMPPPTRPAKRIKRPATVLDEDTYTEALSEIIARDFFPGLLETRTQQEYLDALESQDGEWIASARQKLTEVMTPGLRKQGRRGVSMTPARGPGGMETPRGYGGDTPASVMSDVSTATSMASEKPKVGTNLSLDGFQRRYTSEDNESFYKLLDKQNEKHAAKYGWAWQGNKIPGYRLLKQQEREEKLIKAAAEQEAADGGNKQLAIVRPDERKAMPETWKSKPDNEFMFAPDGIEDEYETVQQRAEAESRAPPKAVVYENTRLPVVPIDAHVEPPSPSLTAVRDAIAGRPRPTASESGYTGGETPRVNGYSFVDDTPSPSPSELGAPPLTWGTIDGSNLLGSGDATPNPFKLKEASKREILHHKMVDRVAKNNRVAAKSGLVGKAGVSIAGTPIPAFASSPRIGRGDLTPAAQRLWSKVASPGGSSRLGGVFDGRAPTLNGKPRESSLRHRWTPTPGVRRSEGE